MVFGNVHVQSEVGVGHAYVGTYARSFAKLVYDGVLYLVRYELGVSELFREHHRVYGECDFIDPMCGSGTLLIEAALIARNMAPGLFRKEYAFEKWNDFDKDLFDEIYNDDSNEREFNHKIYGYDIDIKAVNTARLNVKAAGLTSDITITEQDFKDFTQPEEKSLIVTNPPYGERISTPDLLGTYRMIGDRLKHQFQGNDAWVLSYREECFEQIGLRPSVKIPLYNG